MTEYYPNHLFPKQESQAFYDCIRKLTYAYVSKDPIHSDYPVQDGIDTLINFSLTNGLLSENMIRIAAEIGKMEADIETISI